MTVARRAYLITPATRSAIHRKISANKTWRGTRHGIRMEIEHARQLSFTKNRIHWRARISKGNWIEGHSPSVWDAIEEIETAAGRQSAAQKENNL